MILNLLKNFNTKKNRYTMMSLIIEISIILLINLFCSNTLTNNVYFLVGFVVIYNTLSDLIINKILFGRFTLNAKNSKHK